MNQTTTCRNPACGAPTARPRNGRCERCDIYFRRHRVERHPGLLVRVARVSYPATCCNPACGNVVFKRLVKGRCFVCYGYWLRYDKDRAFDKLHEDRPPCVNCGVALVKGKVAHDRCLNCARYWSKHGIDIALDRKRHRRPKEARHGKARQ